MSKKVLVIEDEPTLSRLLSYNLSQAGFETKVAEDGRVGLQYALQQFFDLIILDIMLPGLNGFEILTKIREQKVKTPIIFLTAKTAEDEIVQGLKLGADDYITKPFGVAELLARVSAVLRRSLSEETQVDETTDENVIILGDLKIYPDQYEVLLNEESISLRPKEFEVLLHMVERQGKVITRDDLMNIVWGFDYIGGQRTVDVHVSSLRKKLELGQNSVKIESIRGVGYKLVVKNN
ncbi:response regulator transcription factor [Chengkuizengella marina]|uniref:Response regulator transcription factor n=1 Tax=Chengkuizengella marina TaxID=2507566 RepID=A0A6N9Q1U4_9BACL|nr:response regulator transcription factor [Chengkuizengella marina]NBI28290.1 response regulator transcription factor [Chengkuizengella marina]